MTAKPIRTPGPGHPISVTPNPNRVVVTVKGQVIADTRAALTLREAAYPPVVYIPRGDVDMASLARSTTTTYCPYKGDAAYFSVIVDGQQSTDAIWTYESPYEAVADIKGHLAFYPDRVDSITEQAV